MKNKTKKGKMNLYPKSNYKNPFVNRKYFMKLKGDGKALINLEPSFGKRTSLRIRKIQSRGGIVMNVASPQVLAKGLTLKKESLEPSFGKRTSLRMKKIQARDGMLKGPAQEVLSTGIYPRAQLISRLRREKIRTIKQKRIPEGPVLEPIIFTPNRREIPEITKWRNEDEEIDSWIEGIKRSKIHGTLPRGDVPGVNDKKESGYAYNPTAEEIIIGNKLPSAQEVLDTSDLIEGNTLKIEDKEEQKNLIDEPVYINNMNPNAEEIVFEINGGDGRSILMIEDLRNIRYGKKKKNKA